MTVFFLIYKQNYLHDPVSRYLVNQTKRLIYGRTSRNNAMTNNPLLITINENNNFTISL